MPPPTISRSPSVKGSGAAGLVGVAAHSILQNDWTERLGGRGAEIAVEVAVAIGGLVELVVAAGALEVLDGAVRLLVINHVAELGRLDHAVQALEHLVGAPRLLVHHVLLDEAHVLRVVAVSVTDALLDGLLEWGLGG